jgi:hypothetical protein
MRKVNAQRKRIEEQRDQLLREIEALKNKVAGLELALSLLGGEEDGHSAQEPSAGRVIKGLRITLMELLREAGTTGLNAGSAVEVAARRGRHLDRQSVASTLSRMKGEEQITYDGERYRLPEFTPDSVVKLRPAG